MIKKTFMAALNVTFLAIITLSFISCNQKGTTPQTIHTTIIQIPAPSGTGSGTQQTLDYEIATFAPIIEFYGETFPVKLLSIAATNTLFDGSPRMVNSDDYIGDGSGDFGVNLLLKSSSDVALNVRIEIEGSRFIERSSQEALVQPGKEVEIFPRIVYKYEALERLIQPANENVYFRLFYGTTMMMEKMETVRFHSVNEVPIAELSRWDNETIIDRSYYFAAYVNEDDPIIDTILKEALQIGVADKIGFGNNFSFSGYQIKDADGSSWLSVDLQVLSIWSVFLKHNIKYSSIATTSTVNEKIATQYVRTLGESFNNSQANCVDGSVLLASVLRKIGIEPFLVIVPGHMFLGYIRNIDPIELSFLETTMLGDTDISKYTKDESWLGKLKTWTGLGTNQSSVILDSFSAAQVRGMELFSEAGEKLNDDENTDYSIIFISTARSLGIMPITRH
jgi:hypothetical protein